MTTGYFQDSLHIGYSLLIGEFGDVDPFIAKHDGNGQFLWARHLDGHFGMDYGSKMVTNSANELYLIPAFDGNGVYKANDQYYLGGSHYDSLTLGSDIYGEYDNRNPVFGVFTHSFGTDNSTPIAKRYSPLAIQTFPNPTSGIIHLEYSQKLESPERALRIYNQAGIEVRDYTRMTGIKGAKTLSLDLSRLPKGMYFIQLRGAEGLHTQKVLKQ